MFNILEVHGGGWGGRGGGYWTESPACCSFLQADKQARIYEQHSWQPYNLTPKYIEDAAYKFLFMLLY